VKVKAAAEVKGRWPPRPGLAYQHDKSIIPLSWRNLCLVTTLE